MGKKKLMITLLILFFVLLTSCSQGNNPKTSGDPQPEPATENPNEKPADKPEPKPKPDADEKPDTNPGVKPAEQPDHNNNNSSPNNPSPSSNPYEITKTNYTENNIKINYPQLKKSSDQQKEKTINELIKNEAIKVLNYYLPGSRPNPRNQL